MALEALLHFPSFQGLSNKLAASLRCEQSILVPTSGWYSNRSSGSRVCEHC